MQMAPDAALFRDHFDRPNLRLAVRSKGGAAEQLDEIAHVSCLYFGLYTILPSRILYDVWDEKGGGSVWGFILHNGRASVAIGQALHVGKGNKRMVDSHNQALK